MCGYIMILIVYPFLTKTVHRIVLIYRIIWHAGDEVEVSSHIQNWFSIIPSWSWIQFNYFSQVLKATNAAAQHTTYRQHSFVQSPLKKTPPLRKICKPELYLYLMYRFFHTNWFWEANGVSCDVIPKRLCLINTNKISFAWQQAY
jgi:hypothetical protein